MQKIVVKSLRELDALVGVKTMQYEWLCDSSNRHSFIAQPNYIDKKAWLKGRTAILFADWDRYLPKYSTEIAAVWEVARKIKLFENREIDGKLSFYRIISSENGKWDVDLYQAEAEPCNVWYDAPLKIDMPSFEIAVCWLALYLNGIEIEMEPTDE